MGLSAAPVLFPYGLLSVWMGWCWLHQRSWCQLGHRHSSVRPVSGEGRGAVLLVGENLWLVITRAGAGCWTVCWIFCNCPWRRICCWFSYGPGARAIQQLVYAALHALAIGSSQLQVQPGLLPLLHGLVALDPL